MPDAAAIANEALELEGVLLDAASRAANIGAYLADTQTELARAIDDAIGHARVLQDIYGVC